ncbi:MAG: hypothetical protein AAF585_27650, partial [Verrucomicrobiota bacterium]
QWYDLESSSLIRQEEDPVASSCLLLDPTGRTLISGAPDGSVYGHDSLTLKQKYVVRVHDKAVEAIAISPDGSQLATSNSGLVRIWRMEDGRPTEMLHELIGNVGTTETLDFSPDGSRLLVTASQLIREFDFSDQTVANFESAESAAAEPDPLLVPVEAEPGKALDGMELARVLANSKWSDPAPVHLEMDQQRNEHYEPFLSPDGEHFYLTLWKQSRWTDIFRFSLTEDPKLLRFDRELDEPINSNKREIGFWSAHGGKIAVVTRSDDPSGNHQIRLFRQSTDGAFVPENETIAQSVASSFSDTSPTMSEDGLILVFVSNRSGTGRLWEARRDSIDEPFGTPVKLPIKRSGYFECKAASLSADGRLLLLTFRVEGLENIYFTVRESVDEPFRDPIPLEEINHPEASDNSAQISSDGRTIYFHSRRESPENKLRLFVSELKE